MYLFPLELIILWIRNKKLSILIQINRQYAFMMGSRLFLFLYKLSLLSVLNYK
jgi:hypothetical protein